MPWKPLKTAAGSGWIEIERAAGSGGWKELSWDVENVDVGLVAVSGNSVFSAAATMITFENAANATATLDKLDVFVHNGGNGTVRIGSVYLASGTDYTCRDAETVSGLSAGLNSDVVISLDVQSGDFLAFHKLSGGATIWKKMNFGYEAREYAGNGLVVSETNTYGAITNNGLMGYASNY